MALVETKGIRVIVDDEITPLGSAARTVAKSLQNTQLAPIWVSLILMGIDLVFVGLSMWFVQFSITEQGFNGIRATLLSGVAAVVFVSILLGSQRWCQFLIVHFINNFLFSTYIFAQFLF